MSFAPPVPVPQSYRERRPAAAVAGHLSSVWVQRVAAGAAPYTHRTVPHAGVELSVVVGAAPRIVGPRTAPAVSTLAPGSTVVGVRFHLGAAPPVLGVPASELVDLDVEGRELLGPTGAALGEAVAMAATPEDAAAIVESAVLARLAAAPAPDPVVAEAVRRLLPWRSRDVGSLTSSLHISERQLRRRTLAAIGLAPKVVQRILRFQAFLALAHAREDAVADLARLAAESGYADQPHLTRESLRLAGLSPRALLRESQEHCFGLHDHATSWRPLLRDRAA